MNERIVERKRNHAEPEGYVPFRHIDCFETRCGCTAHKCFDVNGIAPWLEHCPDHSTVGLRATLEGIAAVKIDGDTNIHNALSVCILTAKVAFEKKGR